ncbi:unnamed protein product, partial [Musa textilis]
AGITTIERKHKVIYRGQVRRGFKSSSEVQENFGRVAGTIQDHIRDLSKFSKVHFKDRRRFAELTGKIRKPAEDSLSLPEYAGRPLAAIRGKHRRPAGISP